MYSIGKFSKITGLSTKTLIWYDNIGLLKPEFVDENNGYRFYGDASFKRLVDIRFWQDLGFTVKEIMLLSKETVDKKIDELEKKVSHIMSNIKLLENIREGNMKKSLSVFEIEGSEEYNSLLYGKWRYMGSTTKFKEVYEGYGKLKKEVSENLFFGEENYGTNLADTFKWSGEKIVFSAAEEYRNKQIDKIYEGLNPFDVSVEKSEKVAKKLANVKELKGGIFWFFLINNDQNLILYEKLSENDSETEVVFHIYSRWGRNRYSKNDIYFLFNKYSKEEAEYNRLPLKELVGKWQIFDEIYESDISNYDGKMKSEEVPMYSLSPMFDNLDITEDGWCYTFPEEETFEIISLSGKKNVLTRENTKMEIKMQEDSENKFAIFNPYLRKKHRGSIRKIDGKHYLFINIELDSDLIEKIYVYKKD